MSQLRSLEPFASHLSPTLRAGPGDFISCPLNWPHAVITLEKALGLSGYTAAAKAAAPEVAAAEAAVVIVETESAAVLAVVAVVATVTTATAASPAADITAVTVAVAAVLVVAEADASASLLLVPAVLRAVNLEPLE